MQASKSHLTNLGHYLGLTLKKKLTTEQMLDALQAELLRLHQVIVWIDPSCSRQSDIAGCRARLDALYEYARRKKFKRVRPARKGK